MQHSILTLKPVAVLMKASELQLELNQCVKNGESVVTSVKCVWWSMIKY